MDEKGFRSTMLSGNVRFNRGFLLYHEKTRVKAREFLFCTQHDDRTAFAVPFSAVHGERCLWIATLPAADM